MDIKKFEPLPPKIRELLGENSDKIVVGGIYISRRNGIKIVRIREVKKNKDEITIHYDEATDWEATEWSQYGSDSPKKFLDEYLRLEKPLEEYLREAAEVISGTRSIEEYSDIPSDSINESHALMHKGSKESLLAMQKSLDEKSRRVEMIKKFVGYEMEKKKQELEAIREKLNGIMVEFKKKIEKVMRVITVIELYLGIEEELFQIQDGPKAKEDTPISFRQQVLYMDEETGHWQGGGLDYTNIKWFDEWLIKNDNFKKLLPEEKGVVVFRPRRNKKEYGGDDWYSNAVKNAANMNNTYLLIRNGECLFRIYTEKIVILPRLFPKRKELENLLAEIDKEEWKRSKEEQKEHVEDLMYQYRKRAILLQGLIDRSEVFSPMSQKLSIFKMDETPGMVNFIYDDEETLPSGRLSFYDWKNKINQNIGEGSRILHTGVHEEGRRDSIDRFYGNRVNSPALPQEGVYVVEEYKNVEYKWLNEEQYQLELKKGTIKQVIKEDDKHQRRLINDNVRDLSKKYAESNYRWEKCYHIQYENTHLTIKYNPGDEVMLNWGTDWRERKNKIRFRIYSDDPGVLNYDQIDLEDIEFYLTSRVDRPNYLDMMPVLEKIKKNRLDELKQEKEFMKFIVGRDKSDLPEKEKIKRVVEAVIWWKYKNKWKRPIEKDDTLALRMIEKRLKHIK
jgi:hypothetical protein